MTEPEGAPPQAARRNIDAVVKSLEESSARRSVLERLADKVTAVLGRPTTLAVHVCVYGAWLIWNAVGARPFDPFPFSLLSLTVSLEAILLTLFVLMSQSRLRTQAEHHAHLDLQVNLLAELEITKTLGLLQGLCAHFGLDAANDREIEELRGRTDPEQLLEDIRSSLPPEE